MHSQQAGLEWHEELNNLCTEAGLKGKKLAKATENFAWNIRVLKGQADLVKQAKAECEEYMRQVNKKWFFLKPFLSGGPLTKCCLDL